MKKITVLELLLQKKLCSSKQEAEALVLAGKIHTVSAKIDSVHIKVSPDVELIVKGSNKKYVSRGGDKLFSAISFFCLNEAFFGKVVLDVGSSTGGFTDCVLQLGADSVVSLDVGKNQLAWKLRNHPRVTSVEGVHLESYKPRCSQVFDWILADLSFTGISRFASIFKKLGARGQTKFLILIKPQFELPRGLVPEGGVVTDKTLVLQAVKLAAESLENVGIEVVGTMPSGVKGRKGNQEVFIFAK